MLGIKIPCVILFYTNQLTHSIENALVSRNVPVFLLKLTYSNVLPEKRESYGKLVTSFRQESYSYNVQIAILHLNRT